MNVFITQLTWVWNIHVEKGPHCLPSFSILRSYFGPINLLEVTIWNQRVEQVREVDTHSGQKRKLDLRKLEFQAVVSYRHECWGQTPGPLYKQQALLPTEPSCQPLSTCDFWALLPTGGEHTNKERWPVFENVIQLAKERRRTYLLSMKFLETKTVYFTLDFIHSMLWAQQASTKSPLNVFIQLINTPHTSH